jgi:hypothetical protein
MIQRISADQSPEIRRQVHLTALATRRDVPNLSIPRAPRPPTKTARTMHPSPKLGILFIILHLTAMEAISHLCLPIHRLQPPLQRFQTFKRRSAYLPRADVNVLIRRMDRNERLCPPFLSLETLITPSEFSPRRLPPSQEPRRNAWQIEIRRIVGLHPGRTTRSSTKNTMRRHRPSR